jgi:predicted ATPase
LAIKQLYVSGYRSVRDAWLNLERVNVLVGPNGCGKSNLYRGMYLINQAASGQFARSLAEEGGMPSVLWAGARTKGPVRLTLSARIGDLKYKLSCGLPPLTPGDPTCFKLDPHIKEEEIVFLRGGLKSVLLSRKESSVTARDSSGKKIAFPLALSNSESVLSGLREPHRFPEISVLREEVLSWRFYHQFRTDALSPLRTRQVGVLTPVLSHDGSDLAAALQTIIEIGDSGALHDAVELAFPGSKLLVVASEGQFLVSMLMPGFHRPFEARELSDGTLHYLCLLAALLSPRPPSLLALNEPETSLHPDLFQSLAKLIASASRHSQLWITTHSRELADFILEYTGVAPIELEKIDGATRVIGAKLSPDDADDEDDGQD